jgi:thiol-disulfide isomerase/thioredoxin
MKYRLRHSLSTSRIGAALSLFLALGAAAAKASTGQLPGALQAYEGKVVYLDFWASWCAPCAESFSWLNEMQARYGDKISIVAVNLDQDPASARVFLARHPARFPVIFDPSGTIASRYEIDGMPSTVVVGPGGGIIHRHSGFLDGKTLEYEAVIRHAVNVPTPAEPTH